MIKELIICDYCRKEERGNEHSLPADWHVLGYHAQTFVDVGDWRIIHHFCSLDHMYRYKDGKRKVVEFLKTPCPHYKADWSYIEGPCAECWQAYLKEEGLDERDSVKATD